MKKTSYKSLSKISAMAQIRPMWFYCGTWTLLENPPGRPFAHKPSHMQTPGIIKQTIICQFVSLDRLQIRIRMDHQTLFLDNSYDLIPLGP